MTNEREIMESTYTGYMDVYGYADVETDYGETRQERRVLLQDVPCALSQYQLRPASYSNSHSEHNYQAKLFVSPDVKIPSGSDIEVRQDGMTYCFKYSGEAFAYISHQEIMIERLSYV